MASPLSRTRCHSFTRLALTEHRQISLNPETVAITFQAKGLDHALLRARTLLEFVALLPKRRATLPRNYALLRLGYVRGR
jgi:hypothetical protein